MAVPIRTLRVAILSAFAAFAVLGAFADEPAPKKKPEKAQEGAAPLLRPPELPEATVPDRFLPLPESGAPPTTIVVPPADDAPEPEGIGFAVRGLRSSDGRGDIPSRGCGGESFPEGTPHYLLGTDRNGFPGYNRFDWWERFTTSPPPPTGPIRQPFRCEFSPALATVVGSQQDGDPVDPHALGFFAIRWDGRVDGSPNGLIDIGFAHRTQSPVGVPVLRDRTFRDGDAVVLIHEAPGPFRVTADPDGHRPSLWLDFDAPRRAVGLEYTFEPVPQGGVPSFDATGALLIAYDRNGEVITIASGHNCTVTDPGSLPRACSEGFAYGLSDNNLASDSLRHRIGVRDAEGRIASVELRYDYATPNEFDGPGARVTEAQSVYRVWHEGFPAAAVLQGTIGFQASPSIPDRIDEFPSFASVFGHSSGSRSIALPYRFDRAMAVLRGFRFEVLDPEPTPIERLGIDLRLNGHDFPRADDPLRVPRRRARLDVRGHVDSGPIELPQRLVAYFALVGWDSDQVAMEVNSARSEFKPWVERQREIVQRNQIDDVSRTVFRDDRSDGALYAAPMGFDLEVRTASQTMDELLLLTGHGNKGLNFAPAFGLLRLGGVVLWDVAVKYRGRNDGYHRTRWHGTLLQGPSVRPGIDVADLDAEELVASRTWNGGSAAITQQRSGRRVPGDPWNLSWQSVRVGRLAWPVRADAAFPALNFFWYADEEPFRLLDTELHGAFYDGRTVDWQIGWGIDTESADDYDGPELHDVLTFPVFGAIARNGDHGRRRLGGRAGETRDAILGCPTEVDPGFVENRGDTALRIESVDLGPSPGHVYFEPGFVWRGLELTLDELRARLPIHLRKKERLGVAATFTGTVGTLPASDPTSRPHVLELVVSAAGAPPYVHRTRGWTAPGIPVARWDRAALDFGIARVPMDATRTANLESVGDVPLCLRRIRVQDPTLGYRVEGLVEAPDGSIGVRVRLVCDATPGACGGATALIAETNAATVSLPLRTAAVSRPSP